MTVGMLPWMAAGGQNSTVQVRVIPAAAAQPLRWMGLGVELDPYEHAPTPARWAGIEQRLDAMRPGFFRVMLNATDYCTGLNGAGEPQYLWQSGAYSAAFDSLLQILDYAESRHIRVFLGHWSPPGALGIRSPADPRWAAMQADLVEYLKRKRHYAVIHDAIFFNEPNGQWMWRRSAPDFAAWMTGIENLRKALDARGLSDVLIAGPDNSGDTGWFDRTVKEQPTLFGAWESHIYATDAEVDGGGIERELEAQTETIVGEDPRGAAKERFIAEAGLRDGKIEALDQQPRVRSPEYGVRMASFVAQTARAGWLGVCAWDLDDAMHGNGHGGLKIWGFWDSSSDEGMTPRPWYAAWSLLSRTLPQGAVIERVEADAGLTATAMRWTDAGGRAAETVVLVNGGDAAKTAVVTDAGLRDGAREFEYADGNLPLDASGRLKPVAEKKGAAGSVAVPAHSVVVLTTASEKKGRLLARAALSFQGRKRQRRALTIFALMTLPPLFFAALRRAISRISRPIEVLLMTSWMTIPSRFDAAQ